MTITTAAPSLPIEGVHIDVPAARYHSWPACSASALRKLSTSTVAHLRWQMEHPLESAAMRLGSALHCLVLEQPRYDAEYRVAPECDRRTTAGKAVYAEFLASIGDRTVITADESARVEEMARQIAIHPSACELLRQSTIREASCVSSIDGCPVKCRVDAASPDWRLVVDVKTTSGLASRSEFERAIANFGYGIQAAHYREVIRAATRRADAATHIAFIVVESDAPHEVACYRLDDAVIGLFAQRLPRLRREWHHAMTASRGSRASRAGWSTMVQEIGVPPWLRRQLEEEVCDE